MKSIIRQLKNEITQAKEAEAIHATLAGDFKRHSESLPTAIAINASSPHAALSRLVNDYVDSLSEHLLAFVELAEEANITDYVEPFLSLACTYFLQPPDALKTYEGLQSAFYKAYLCQRILEEVNDQVMNLGGAPLAPMDMSTANIICHTLIGDDLANQLDHLVLLTMETANADKTVFDKQDVKDFMEKRKLSGWQQVLERWPCFTKDYAIDLQLGDH